VPEAAELMNGSVADRAALRAALEGIDVVFHEAAYGGYMPEIAKYVLVNSYGTALLLETIRDENLPVKKLLVASSQVVYSEGAVVCPVHGRQFPPTRPLAQLQRGDWSVHCPVCDGPTEPTATPEEAPIGGGDFPYVLTKVDQERLVLGWGRQTGIPTVALRYSCTYGPRQSIFNPYTGVIAIFATRLLAGQPPVLYEDGLQTRDFCFVEDVAEANFLAATSDKLDGLPVNVGSGVATTIREVARMVADGLGIAIEPVARGEFRPGEIRYLTSGIARAAAVGYRPRTDVATGIGRYLDWIRGQGDVRDYFGQAEQVLKERRIVQRVGVSSRTR
jgi:dTDP-L-rhamnose 4-epimerase